MEMAKGIFDEVKNVVTGISKDPTGIAKNSGEMSFGASLSLLCLEALSIFLILWSVISKVVSVIKESMGMFATAIKVPGTIYFYSLLAGILSVALLFCALWVSGKIFKSTLDTKGLLSSMAVASIPRAAANLVVMILVFILGLTNTLMMYLVVLASTFGMIMGYYLLEISMRRLVPQKTNNMLIIAVAYAIQQVAFMFVTSGMVNSLLEKFTGSSLSGLFRNFM